jgi:hypothetical protein
MIGRSLWLLVGALPLVGCVTVAEEIPDGDREGEVAGSADNAFSVLGQDLYAWPDGSTIPADRPEGLYVLGSFNRSRPTIIYSHGWVTGEMPRFMNFHGWQNSGFNTVLFRWHQQAQDAGCHIPMFGNFPCGAEGRIHGQDGSRGFVGELFVRAYKALFPAGAGAGEVRLVGHSLGTQVVTYGAYRLHREGYGGARPIRIDLLDWYSSPYSPGSPHPSYILPNDLISGDACAESNRTTYFCRSINSMQWLKDNGDIAIVNYRSVTSRQTGNDLHFVAPTVEFGTGWLGGNNTLQHTRVVDWYMCASPAQANDAACWTGAEMLQPWHEARTTKSFPSLSDADALIKETVFNWRHYVRVNGDLWNANIRTRDQAIQHWRNHGARECRQAHPYFHPRQYLELNGDLVNAFGWDCHRATLHYVRNGLAEQRFATHGGKRWQPVFDGRMPTSALRFMGGRAYIFRIEAGFGTALPFDDIFNP